MSRPRHTLSFFSSVAALALALSGCSITETINDILSSTTPGDWFTGDGLLKGDQKVNAFVAFNFENLKQDMARGHFIVRRLERIHGQEEIRRAYESL